MHNLYSSNKKEVKRIDNKGKEIKRNIISNKLQFIDCVRFIASSLLNLFDNLTETIHKIISKYEY